MKCWYIEGSKNGTLTGPYGPVNFYLCKPWDMEKAVFLKVRYQKDRCFTFNTFYSDVFHMVTEKIMWPVSEKIHIRLVSPTWPLRQSVHAFHGQMALTLTIFRLSLRIIILCHCSLFFNNDKDHFLLISYGTKWSLCVDVPLNTYSFIHSTFHGLRMKGLNIVVFAQLSAHI